jgi:hypothetical protein
VNPNYNIARHIQSYNGLTLQLGFTF